MFDRDGVIESGREGARLISWSALKLLTLRVS
jgi:hypothetical protein